MKLLLDTHVLIWIVRGVVIPAGVEAAVKSAVNEVYVSVITPWEISIKAGLGKFAFDQDFLEDFDNHIRALAFTPLPVKATHGVAAGRLSGRNRDPFDRMLAAQAISEGLTLATADHGFNEFPVTTMWS